MRFAVRLSPLPFLVLLTVLALAASAVSARAAEPYTVSVSPASEPVAPGATAVFRIRVEGQIAALPSFQYDVQGGTLQFNIGYNGAAGGGTVTHNGSATVAASRSVWTIGRITFEPGAPDLGRQFDHAGLEARPVDEDIQHALAHDSMSFACIVFHTAARGLPSGAASGVPPRRPP